MPTCPEYYKDGNNLYKVLPNDTVIEIALDGNNFHGTVNPSGISAETVRGYTPIDEQDYVFIVIGNTAVSFVGGRPDIDPA